MLTSPILQKVATLLLKMTKVLRTISKELKIALVQSGRNAPKVPGMLKKLKVIIGF